MFSLCGSHSVPMRRSAQIWIFSNYVICVLYVVWPSSVPFYKISSVSSAYLKLHWSWRLSQHFQTFSPHKTTKKRWFSCTDVSNETSFELAFLAMSLNSGSWYLFITVLYIKWNNVTASQIGTIVIALWLSLQASSGRPKQTAHREWGQRVPWHCCVYRRHGGEHGERGFSTNTTYPAGQGW